jgi:hypothetical protein
LRAETLVVKLPFSIYAGSLFGVLGYINCFDDRCSDDFLAPVSVLDYVVTINQNALILVKRESQL